MFRGFQAERATLPTGFITGDVKEASGEAPSHKALSTLSGGGSERVRPWDVSTLPLGRKNVTRDSRSQDTLS